MKEVYIVKKLTDIWSAIVTTSFYDSWGLICGSLLSLLIYIVLLIGVAILLYKRKKFLDAISSVLTILFIFIWVAGFLVYDYGMYPGDAKSLSEAVKSLIGVGPMAIIHSFEMFVLQSDISAIHDHAHDSTIYMTFFSIVHLAAAFVSMVFVVKHFGFSIVSASKRLIYGYFAFKKKENLFVFWGMNEATYSLALSLANKIGGNNDSELSEKNSKVFIVRTTDDTEVENEKNNFFRLFNFISLRTHDYVELKELNEKNCLSSSTFAMVSDVKLDDVNDDSKNDILGEKLNLRCLKRLMNLTTKRVHIFFLGDDEVSNINSVANLRHDATLKKITDEGVKIKFYCHARYNSIHRVIEDDEMPANMEVKVVDSSHISVELMKKNAELQPINFVEVEKDATVSSPFNSLVIGFGEVGLDAVRFLYEFSAFVKTGGSLDRVERSDFHCHIVDKRMNELSGKLVSNAPAVPIAWNDKQVKALASATKIEMHNMDCLGPEFAERLQQWVKNLNYVVVATENDETNISLAVKILRMALRYRANMENFRIMVRIREDENGHFRKIANHYNRLHKANIEALKAGTPLHQTIVRKCEEKLEEPIKLFGSDSEIYTYDNIIDDKILKDAKEFFRIYEGKSEFVFKDKIYADLWEKRHMEAMQVIGYMTKDNVYCETKDFSPTYEAVNGLRRMESQDFANSMHNDTKRALYEKALSLQGINKEDFKINRSDRKNVVEYNIELLFEDKNCKQKQQAIQTIIDTIAQTEHLRWNASHEILGYVRGDKKDETRMKHGCLKPWQELPEQKKYYDYNVVDVSLNIIRS